MVSTTSTLLALCFVLNLFYISVAESLDAAHGSCKQLLRRKEWRALNDGEKKYYIDAVKCLQSRPAHNTSRPASWSRFDEFQAIHIELALNIHAVAQFLPWHRHFVKSYENALRNECGYQGAHPYWNWSLDADPPNLFSKSPIWDPVTGFGGNGVPGTYVVPDDPAHTSRLLPELFGGCVKNGPFANYTLKMGPGLLVTEHCLTRSINDTFSVWFTSLAVAYTSSFPTYEQFRLVLEGEVDPPVYGLHIGVHFAMGGEESSFFSSPGDTLFFLHHTNLDRIWWHWQGVSPERLYEVSGRTSITPPFGNLDLNFPLRMGDVGPTIPVRDVMDIRKEPSCYMYV